MKSPQHTEDQTTVDTVRFSGRIGAKGRGGSVLPKKCGDSFVTCTPYRSHQLPLKRGEQ